MNSIRSTLAQLHDDYVERVNLAVSENRFDLVEKLSAQFDAIATNALRELSR